MAISPIVFEIEAKISAFWLDFCAILYIRPSAIFLPSQIFVEKTLVVYLMRSSGCRELWVSQTKFITRSFYQTHFIILSQHSRNQGKTCHILFQTRQHYIPSHQNKFLETFECPTPSLYSPDIFLLHSPWPVLALPIIWRYQKLGRK